MNQRTVKLLKAQYDLLTCQDDICGIYSSRSMGKTYCASILAAMELSKDKRILVLAQNYKSLSENVFTEIVKRLEDFKIPHKVNKSTMTISNDTGGRIMCGSYENLDSMRGFTEISLAILDEVAYAPADLFAVISPCLRGAGIKPKIRFFSSPKMHSWFNTYLKENNIKYFTGTIYDNKFISDESRALMEKSIKSESLRRQELFGEMIDGVGDNGLLYPSDFSITLQKALDDYNIYVGIDPSGYGRDNNVVVIRTDRQVLDIFKKDIASAADIASWLDQKLHIYGLDRVVEINIDMGYGQAIYEILNSRYPVLTNLVPFSSKPDSTQYYNKRTEMYFNLQKAVKDGFFVPNDDELHNVLCNTTYDLKGDKLLLNPKEELKDIIGHSPDMADALALTFAKINTPATVKRINGKTAREDNDAAYFSHWMSSDF